MLIIIYFVKYKRIFIQQILQVGILIIKLNKYIYISYKYIYIYKLYVFYSIENIY